MYLSQTVHHQILCHLQCTCFSPQDGSPPDECVICNVPVSDSSPPDIVSSSMYLFQTVHHQILCHLQCTCFSPQDGSPPDIVSSAMYLFQPLRRFAIRYCVICNVPVSAPKTVRHQILCHLQCTCFSPQDGSPPDIVSSAMYLFQPPRRFATRYCVICNVPVSAPKKVRHQMSVSSAVYLSQTVHHQILCHLQCTCLRQFTTRYCVICNVPVSDSSPPDNVSSSVYLSQTVHHQILCHLQYTCFRQFTTRYCVICNVPVSDSSPPDIVSFAMYLFQPPRRFATR